MGWDDAGGDSGDCMENFALELLCIVCRGIVAQLHAIDKSVGQRRVQEMLGISYVWVIWVDVGWDIRCVWRKRVVKS